MGKKPAQATRGLTRHEWDEPAHRLHMSLAPDGICQRPTIACSSASMQQPYHKFVQITPMKLDCRIDERSLSSLPSEVQKFFYDVNWKATLK